MKQPVPLRDRFRESTRGAILDAAADAFNTAGASTVRMEDIAAGAGIAVGTLYNYFSDRQALVSAVLQSHTQGLLDALDDAAESGVEAGPAAPAAVTAELSRFVGIVVRHWNANRVLLTLLIEDVLRGGANVNSVNRQQTVATQLQARAEKLLTRGIAAGVLRPADTAIYAAMLLGMVRGVVAGAIERGDVDFADRSSEIVRVFLQGAAL